MAKSEEFKAKANKCFADNQLKEAIELYVSALELNPSNHILYANRAFCHIKLENYGSAILDASEAIRREPSYIKGYYRRGTANLALGKLKQAKWDFREAVKIEPGNKEARNKLADCDKVCARLCACLRVCSRTRLARSCMRALFLSLSSGDEKGEV